MRLTFALADEQHAANDRSGIMVGLPLTVQLDAGTLVQGPDFALAWFERARAGVAQLKAFSLNRCVFLGRIAQIEVWQDGEDVVCQALLDCGIPLRFDLWDPDFDAQRMDRPYELRQGDWLAGEAVLQGLLASDPGDLLWQPLHGTIVDIQRLYLEPRNPGFGTLRWFHGLPAQSFAPDHVFVTVEV